MTIDPKFYKGDMIQPTAKTVGELKAILQELPDELPIEFRFSEAVQVVVYNHGRKNMHLSFDEPEQ
jgi:hypothetical protein